MTEAKPRGTPSGSLGLVWGVVAAAGQIESDGPWNSDWGAWSAGKCLKAWKFPILTACQAGLSPRRFFASLRVRVILQGRLLARPWKSGMESTHHFLYSLNLVGSPRLCDRHSLPSESPLTWTKYVLFCWLLRACRDNLGLLGGYFKPRSSAEALC